MFDESFTARNDRAGYKTTKLGMKCLIVWVRDDSTVWVRNVLAGYKTTEVTKQLVTLQSIAFTKN